MSPKTILSGNSGYRRVASRTAYIGFIPAVTIGHWFETVTEMGAE